MHLIIESVRVGDVVKIDDKDVPERGQIPL